MAITTKQQEQQDVQQQQLQRVGTRTTRRHKSNKLLAFFVVKGEARVTERERFNCTWHRQAHFTQRHTAHTHTHTYVEYKLTHTYTHIQTFCCILHTKQISIRSALQIKLLAKKVSICLSLGFPRTLRTLYISLSSSSLPHIKTRIFYLALPSSLRRPWVNCQVFELQ